LPDSPEKSPRVTASAFQYWRDRALDHGRWSATVELLTRLWEFLRESTPSRRRQRFGDADYDWDFRVNTTSGAVNWRDRLLGVFHSPYQPTEPDLFREMITALQQGAGLDFSHFTFIDLGSGKGRTLLLASEYPFQRIVGVELLPSLQRIAQQNLARYASDSQKCFVMESQCADATTFAFPKSPIVLFLFNPFPESGLRRVLTGLAESLDELPRPAYVLYHNPQLEHVLQECRHLRKIRGTHQYSIFEAVTWP
jgi:SAM-dependent methyltransferase